MLQDTMFEMVKFVGDHWILVVARAVIEPALAVVMDITLDDSGVGSWALNLLNVILFVLSAIVVRVARKYHRRILTIPGMRVLTAVGDGIVN